MNNQKYIDEKKKRREIKKKDRRSATAEEVIFIFEKILEGWRTIRIYNTIIQLNPKSDVKKIMLRIYQLVIQKFIKMSYLKIDLNITTN